MHRYRALGIDLGWVALSPFLALLIRDNFVVYQPRWEAVTAYAAISVATAVMVFLIAGSHKTLWHYTSLPDVLRVMAVATVVILLALSISFVESWLEGVARSVPVIQWFLLFSGMVGTRVAFRIWHEQVRRERWMRARAFAESVLIVGASPLTDLYLRAVAEYGSKTVAIVGILSGRSELSGRRLRQHEILGTPEELPRVMAQLEVHGIIVSRIAVMQPLEEFSGSAGEALLAVERGSDVKVDWMIERLGLVQMGTLEDESSVYSSVQDSPTRRALPATCRVESFSLGGYSNGYVKRAFDILAALVLSAALGPLILVVSLLVVLDIGFPLVFWQQRPGRFGRPFKLFKFCSMGRAHDVDGERIPDEERSSIIGRLLRRTKLDELPQLYNILIGEMSFVGPRPLLFGDQPDEMNARLSVRPGLTGFAQVYGTRDLSPDDKNTLDIWYLRNASLWLDIKIVFRTVIVMIKGESLDYYALRDAQAGLERLNPQGIGSRVVDNTLVEMAGPAR